MTELSTITDYVASNRQIFAPVVAFLVAWLLYGVLGKRFLGADDDFWPRIRGWALPKIDRLADDSHGVYAEAYTEPNEYVGYFVQDLADLDADDGPVDPFERHLERAGYSRNPLAAYKSNSEGWESDGSWARRYGYVRGTGDVLRALGSNSLPLPIDPRWLAGMVGRFLQGAGDVFATRQIHATLYVQPVDGEEIARVHVYCHDEPNSLNPLTALAHVQSNDQRKLKGVREFLDDMGAVDVQMERMDSLGV